MMKIRYTTSFIRSAKKYNKKGYPMDKVEVCVTKIIENDQTFLHKHKDHALSKGIRELHIDRQYNDNWLLYYRFNKITQELELELIDLSNHDNLTRIIKIKG